MYYLSDEKEIYNPRVKRKANLLYINNCEITKDEKINEIREITSKNEREKGLCEKVTSFHNLQ